MNTNTNTASRPVLVGTNPDLPDDPRDCCKAAHAIMGDEFGEAEEMVRDMLALTFAALPDLMESSPDAERLRRCIGRAEDAMATVSDGLDKIGALMRHGRGDLRKIDAMLAERAQALDEGREPPYEPSWGEVRGAMAGAQNAGKPITEAEAVALLKAQQEDWK